VLVLGIDLASRPAGTAACLLECEPGAAAVRDVTLGLTDDDIVRLAVGVAKIGIDIPLGWPRRFVEALSAHTAGDGWPPGYDHDVDKRAMCYRRTDRAVSEAPYSWPLSVSADRIAIPAMRGVHLARRLVGGPVDLSGQGLVVEVYPAVALHRWGLRDRGYKGAANPIVRRRTLGDLLATASVLDVGPARDRLVHSDHCFDALIAALVATAHVNGHCDPVPDDATVDAQHEGWIAVPNAELDRCLRA